MDSRLLLCSPSCYLGAGPRIPLAPNLPLSAEKTSFLGKGLILERSGFRLDDSRKWAPLPIRAVIKRRKELPLDNVIQRDKKLKLVTKIRRILVSQPNRIMQLRQLGRFRRDLGLTKKRRFIALLRKFPAVFEIVEDGAFSLQFKLTPEAESLYLEELKFRNQMEDMLVVKLRKLLMMSLEKRILLEKISHLRTDLGLPLGFQDTICRRYPQYFRVVETERGPALELTDWDPELAVSAAELAEEENLARELEEKNLIIDRPPRFNRVRLPKGLSLPRGDMRRIGKFRDMAYVSPYSDFSRMRSGTPEKEKHACGVVHEILSLTVEKRTLVDHLTHFREEFRFSQQVRGMLIRHPDMFYVSLKGDRDSVFLREAYRDSQLIEKDRLLLIKEKFRSLVAVPRFPKRNAPRNDGDGSEEDSDQEDVSGMEDEEDWDDVENLLSGEDGFEDGDSEDDDDGGWSNKDGDTPPDFSEDDDDDGGWSNKDGDTPPDFSEDDNNVKIHIIDGSSKQAEDLRYKKEKVLQPVFPDGQPRERW